MYKFKVGDSVKVVRKFVSGDFKWWNEMNEAIGKTGKITGMFNYNQGYCPCSIKFDTEGQYNGWTYLTESLELTEPYHKVIKEYGIVKFMESVNKGKYNV